MTYIDGADSFYWMIEDDLDNFEGNTGYIGLLSKLNYDSKYPSDHLSVRNRMKETIISYLLFKKEA